ncbi:MAG TPA: helix-turn-helix domain-containing protein [Draconibacterium sp.]|nr:helix-turn-helix domain-containing protein [Draconibacterium sp.]
MNKKSIMPQDIINPKYQDILKTARELFWKHGFKRVSIEEICKKAGVSKMTYYRFFPNKIELAKTVFNNEIDEGRLKFRNLMEADIPAKEKIKGIILLKAEGTNNISKEFLEDFYMGTEPELKTFVEERTKETWNELLQDWTLAQGKGFFRKDFKPEFFLRATFKLVDLLKDEELNKLYDKPQDLIMEFANFVAYGISPHE